MRVPTMDILIQTIAHAGYPLWREMKGYVSQVLL